MLHYLCFGMKRLFAAIKIHPDEAFMRLYYALKTGCKYDKINWVKPENIHITLKFFGETDPDLIPEINTRLNDLAQHHSAFSMVLKGTGVFGSFYKPRVLWLGIEDNPRLIELGHEILEEMDSIGFKKDRQNFVPHLSIGRIKLTDNKERFFDLVERYKKEHISNLKVDQFHLFESKLSSSGPSYSILNSFSLKT